MNNPQDNLPRIHFMYPNNTEEACASAYGLLYRLLVAKADGNQDVWVVIKNNSQNTQKPIKIGVNSRVRDVCELFGISLT